MKQWMIAVLAVLTVGCIETPTERIVNKISENVVRPAVEKAINELNTDYANLNGDIQGVEPGYETEFEGFWVTGIKGKVVVRAIGVAGNITGTIGSATRKKVSAAAKSDGSSAKSKQTPGSQPSDNLNQLN